MVYVLFCYSTYDPRGGEEDIARVGTFQECLDTAMARRDDNRTIVAFGGEQKARLVWADGQDVDLPWTVDCFAHMALRPYMGEAGPAKTAADFGRGAGYEPVK